MKKIRIPLMIQDPRIEALGGMDPVEGYDPVRAFFLDGPTTEKVAILDFDPDGGELVPGARFNKGKVRGWYENFAGENLYDVGQDAMYTPEFMQVSVFATVLRTMDLFEKTDTLGRALHWAFEGPQLLVIPRAGLQANAFYHRDTHSLQFFYFPSNTSPQEMIYTCLSRDIVAHETGHAIIDGLAPDLLDACSPQSLAIHEAMADLTAVLMAFSSHNLRLYLLEQGKGSIEGQNPFTTIAEEFGAERGHGDCLRSLHNEKTLDPAGGDNFVSRSEPHALSEVLSGAMYHVMVNIHEDLKDQYAQLPQYKDKRDPRFSASGYALRKGAERLKRMAFRALDYLPPGEVSFADYGRALIAVDCVAYPDDPKMRRWVREEFIRRHIVPDTFSLEVDVNFQHKALQDIDIPTLFASDWAAYQFVNKNRRLLGIPPRIPFHVRPRLEVLKKYDYDRTVRECILKVSWDLRESNPLGPRFPNQRQITVGTTIAFDWDTGTILARLTNAPPLRAQRKLTHALRVKRQQRFSEARQQRKDRDVFIRNLLALGLLKMGSHAIGPDKKPLFTAVRAEESEGVMRLQGTANMLHITGVDDG
jgi:hypothetical protein